ncbi:MAG TPA: TlpA disulfide reductase family protein [Cyclobacteriaceae bacterium]|nr:TlpA disulfide reductase family protein [Cyclobacteriaceae bacterium]
MKKLKLILLFQLVTFGVYAQKIEVVKFGRLQQIIESKEEKIQVINFWATWCAPCVKELPYFETLNARGDKDIKVSLISLDFADKLDRVNSFVERKQMKADVLLLDEIDYNSWIDRVEKSWSGAIPATLIINTSTGKRKFIEGELEEGDLEKLIAQIR